MIETVFDNISKIGINKSSKFICSKHCDFICPHSTSNIIKSVKKDKNTNDTSKRKANVDEINRSEDTSLMLLVHPYTVIAFTTTVVPVISLAIAVVVFFSDVCK